MIEPVKLSKGWREGLKDFAENHSPYGFTFITSIRDTELAIKEGYFIEEEDK